ncbi:hypothetical protein SAMN04487760_101422 [Lachnospiraceae bacterium G41]|nr:hypothetical protein SAMN04487760_101422 [Lachnospiraceae bacterium G41]
MSKFFIEKIIKTIIIGAFAVATFGSLYLTAYAENVNTDTVGSSVDSAIGTVNEAVEAAKNLKEEADKVGLSIDTITQAADNLDNELYDRDWNDSLQENQHRRLVKVEVRPAWDETIREEWTETVKINLRIDENGDEIYDDTEEVVHPAEVVHHEAEYEYRSVEYFDDNNPELEDAKEAMKDVKDAVSLMEEENTLVSGNVAAANDDTYKINGYEDNEGNHVDGYVEIADGLEKKAEGLLEVDEKSESGESVNTISLVDFVNKAGDAVDEAIDNIKNSTSKEDADKFKQDAKNACDEADKIVNEKAKELTEIEKKFIENEENYKVTKKAYDDKLTELKAAQERFNYLKDQADSEAEAADAELQRIADEAKELKQATDDALESYNTAGYGYIAYLERELKTKTEKERKDYIKLAWAIMKFYYVPDVLGNQEGVQSAEMDTSFENFYKAWKFYSGENGNNSITYTDENGNTYTNDIGDTLDYGRVNYTVKHADGTEEYKTIYIELKTSDENNLNSDNYNGIVIFEKTPHIVFDGVDFAQASVDAIEANGYYVDYDGAVYVKVDDNYVKYTDGNTIDGEEIPEDEVEEVEGLSLGDGESKNDVVVGEEAVSYKVDSQTGKMVKTVTKDVTVTTYTGVSLPLNSNGSIDAKSATLESEEAAKTAYINAVQDKIDELEANQTITIGDDENAKVYKIGDTADLTGFELDKDENEEASKYGYKALEYLISTTTVNTQCTGTVTDTYTYTISTTIYDSAKATSTIQLRNDNWYSGNVLLVEYDDKNDPDNSYNHYTTDGKQGGASKSVTVDASKNDDFRNKVDASKNDDFRNKVDSSRKILDLYFELSTKAGNSQEAIKTAQSEIRTLRGEIAAFESKVDTINKLDEYTASLEASKEALKKAQDKRDTLLKKLVTVDKEYQKKITALENEENNNNQNNNSNVPDEPNKKAEDDTKDDKAKVNNNANVNSNANANNNVRTNDNVNSGVANEGIVADDKADIVNAGGRNVIIESGVGNDGGLEAENADDDSVDKEEHKVALLTEEPGDNKVAENDNRDTAEATVIVNDQSAPADAIEVADSGKSVNWMWIALGAVALGTAVAGGVGFSIYMATRKK